MSKIQPRTPPSLNCLHIADAIPVDDSYMETPLKSVCAKAETRCDSRRALHAEASTAAGELGTTLRERRLGLRALEEPLRVVVTPITEIELEQRRLFIEVRARLACALRIAG